MPLKTELDEASMTLKKAEDEVYKLGERLKLNPNIPELKIAHLHAMIMFLLADSRLQEIFHEALEERVQALENKLKALSKSRGRGPKKPSGTSASQRGRRQ